VRRPRGARQYIVSGVIATCLLSASSCATFKQNDVAVRLNGHSLTTKHLSDMARSDLYATYLQSGIVDGLANGDAARNVLTAWLKLELLDQAGVFAGVDRSAVSATLEQANGASWAAAPVELRDLLILNEEARQLTTNGTLDPPTALARLATADVYVDARYGRWDPATISVVPLQS
jgi:hypothetical protein